MGRPRTDIRLRIVHAARARFLLEGVDGASLRTIAKDAKTNVGMIFYYFPTKDELFLEIVEEVYAKLLADVAALLGEGATARERLQAASARLGAASEEELDVLRLVVREALVSSERLARLLPRFQVGHLAMVAGLVGQGTVAGEIDPELPPAVVILATMAVTLLPQILRRVLGDRAPLPLPPAGEPLAKPLVDLLFSGIGAPRAKKH